jgi:hypothetical protein
MAGRQVPTPPTGPPRPCFGPAPFAITTAMTKRRSDTDIGAPAAGAPPAKPGRGERLSAALRANLARRKVQARARARKGAQDAPGGGDGDKPGAGDRAGEGSHDSAGFIADKRTVE